MDGWKEGRVDRWMNRSHSYASSRCSVYISALYLFACKRDVGRSPPSCQCGALMRGCEPNSARVPLQPRVSGRRWGLAGTRAHHESPCRQPLAQPPRTLLAAQPHWDRPGREPGQSGPACGVHPAWSHAHCWGHRTGSRAPVEERTPRRGEQAGRVHGSERASRLADVLATRCLYRANQEPGVTEHSAAPSAPLRQHRGLRMSWRPQFQLPRRHHFTVVVPPQSQPAKRQEGRTWVQDASVAPLTPPPTPTTRVLAPVRAP